MSAVTKADNTRLSQFATVFKVSVNSREILTLLCPSTHSEDIQLDICVQRQQDIFIKTAQLNLYEGR